MVSRFYIFSPNLSVVPWPKASNGSNAQSSCTARPKALPRSGESLLVSGQGSGLGRMDVLCPRFTIQRVMLATCGLAPSYGLAYIVLSLFPLFDYELWLFPSFVHYIICSIISVVAQGQKLIVDPGPKDSERPTPRASACLDNSVLLCWTRA